MLGVLDLVSLLSRTIDSPAYANAARMEMNATATRIFMEPDYPPHAPHRRAKGLSSRLDARAVVVLLAAMICAGAALRLGLWQLDRAAQKQSLQQALNERSSLPLLAQTALADSPEAAAAQHQRRVSLRGEWIASATIYLDNRQMNSRPGFFVLTPLQLQRGADTAEPSALPGPLIWVQRGWVARDNDVRTRLPQVPTPAGPVEVIGRVAPPPARLFELGEEARGPIRQNLVLEASAIELAQSVLPMTVLQTETAPGAPDGLLRDWPAPAVDIQKHYGYAFQWFALGAVVICLYAWFQIIRPRWRTEKRETV